MSGAPARWMMTRRDAPLGFMKLADPSLAGLSGLTAFHANWGCPRELYPQALEFVLGGRIKIAPFVEKHPLSAINEVFAAAHAGALNGRAVLVPTHEGARS